MLSERFEKCKKGLIRGFKMFCGTCLFDISGSEVQALQASGVHSQQEYIEFAQSKEAFKAAGYVQDQKNHAAQTGVLVCSNIVVTAAHGVLDAWKSAKKSAYSSDVRTLDQDACLNVGFSNRGGRQSRRSYRVTAIALDPRYLSCADYEKPKYDIAFLKLEYAVPIWEIQPARFFDTTKLPEDVAFSVAIFGRADLKKGAPVCKRAFMLFELDDHQPVSSLAELAEPVRKTILSSVFFKPEEAPKHVSPWIGDEQQIRNYRANLKWHQLDKPPYALCLPGSSGAPVFVTTQDKQGRSQTYLFGLVNSFTHLSTNRFFYKSGSKEVDHILNADLTQIYGRYQTIITPLYYLYDDIKEVNMDGSSRYVIDPKLIQLIQNLQNA